MTSYQKLKQRLAEAEKELSDYYNVIHEVRKVCGLNEVCGGNTIKMNEEYLFPTTLDGLKDIIIHITDQV